MHPILDFPDLCLAASELVAKVLMAYCYLMDYPVKELVTMTMRMMGY